jgi:hypothetical protein
MRKTTQIIRQITMLSTWQIRMVARMNNKFFHKIVAITMAVAISIGMLPSGMVYATGNTNEATVQNEENDEDNVYKRVEIRTVEDFNNFAQECYVDSWSKNKYVILMNDIDFTEADFIPVPVFSGTFDGNGYTISGFNYVGAGYVVGLFRYVENNGMIKSLTLKGNVSSEGEQECIGSIAGINRGTIKNCTFIGTVSGRDTVGGIVGINEATGTISGCVSKGRVTAYYSTGGIAGINHGAINYCTNNSGINDNEAWVETDDEMGGVEMVKSLVTEEENEIYSGVDTGGIAGYSDGYIMRCTNKGVVGYEHTGYNVGGIVGRQSGVVSISINNGTVYGRKDIGGIAGQMEPDIEVNDAESLRDALDKLHTLTNKTIDDMSATKNVVKQDLDNMQKYADAAIDSGDILVTRLTDFTDDNITEVNTLSERMEHVMDMIPEIIDDTDQAGSYAKVLSENLNQLVQDLDFVDKISDEDREKINGYKKDLNDTAITQLQDESDELAELSNQLNDLSQKNVVSLKDFVPIMTSMVAISEDMMDTAKLILTDVMEIEKVLEPYVTSAAKIASDDADKASEAARNTIDSLKSANNNLKSMVNYINAQEDLRFTTLGDDFDTVKETFHNNLKGISSSIKSLSDNASAYTDVVNNDLKSVSDQLNVVFNLLADRVTEVEDLDLDDLYKDVSDEDIEAITTGRVEYCENNGVIQGDINIGGIAGSMAIDDEDPEDSAAGNAEYKLGRSYIAKCLIIGSVNNGYITAKKDGAGGVCGYMNHGVIVDSEGYGKVESSEGDYAGGICGQSLTIIRNCYALCSVSGGQYVGGIAGYADTLTGCYAMVDVTAENGRAGAIAGQVSSYEEVGTDEVNSGVSGNYFVNDELYGIDNISYVGVAEPITYQELLQVENIPTEFWHLQVIYWIEDTYLGSEEVKYGDTLDNLTYPEIPQKEGYYGVWPDVTGRTVNGTVVVEAEYKDNVTVVKSTGVDDEKALALVEDIFTEDTVLIAKKVEMDAPAETVGKNYVVYDLSLEDDALSDTDTFAVRLLNPYDDNAIVYAYIDGNWQELDSKVRGQYLQVEMQGTQQYFCILDNVSNKYILWACAGVGAFLILIVILIIKRGVRAIK